MPTIEETYKNNHSLSPGENKVTIINNYTTVNGRLYNSSFESLSEKSESDVGINNIEKDKVIEVGETGKDNSHYDDIRDKILNLNSVDSNTEIYQNNSPSVRIIFYSTPYTKNITYGIININNKNTNSNDNDINNNNSDNNNNNINNNNSSNDNNEKINHNSIIEIKCDHFLNENKNIKPIESHEKLNHKTKKLYNYSWLPNYLKDDDFDDMDSLYI